MTETLVGRDRVHQVRGGRDAAVVAVDRKHHGQLLTGERVAGTRACLLHQEHRAARVDPEPGQFRDARGRLGHHRHGRYWTAVWPHHRAQRVLLPLVTQVRAGLRQPPH